MNRSRLGWILLAHWHESEARAIATLLEAEGWQVRIVWWREMIKVRELHEDIPRAVAVSLRRLPTHGSDLGKFLQSFHWSRGIPLIFFDGSDQTITDVRGHVPGAHFCAFDQLSAMLENTDHWRQP